MSTKTHKPTDAEAQPFEQLRKQNESHTAAQHGTHLVPPPAPTGELNHTVDLAEETER